MDSLRAGISQQLKWLEILCQSRTAQHRLQKFPSALEIKERKKSISDYCDKCDYDVDLKQVCDGLWQWRKKSCWLFPTLAEALAAGQRPRKRPGADWRATGPPDV